MKKILVLSIVILSFFANIICAHKQSTHEYITQQAYKLLQLTLLKKYPEMMYHLGSRGGQHGIRTWDSGTLLAGAWREDEEDVVYNYRHLDNTLQDGWLTSITHFWKPDDGDASENQFVAAYFSGIPYIIERYPNAYSKMQKYVNGEWEIWYDEDGMLCPSPVFGPPANTSLRRIKFSYLSLIDFYLTGRVKSWGCVTSSNVEYTTPAHGIGYLSVDIRQKIVYQILGRMCHLLQDMSVPAHTHNDMHGSSYPSVGQDCYENMFSFDSDFGYDAQSIYNSYGGFAGTTSGDPIHFLMYTTAQMADHFGSNGPDGGLGNNLIGGNRTNYEYSYLTNSPNNIAGFGAPTTMTNPLTHEQKINIRSKMIPQAIRATAGLLYWFITQVNLASIPYSITGAYVWGTSELYEGGFGNWYVSHDDGPAPFTYSWEVKKISTATAKSKVTPRALPGGEWCPAGTNSSTLRIPYSALDTRDFEVRCTVTDGVNTTKVSNSFFVDVIAGSPPFGQIIATDTGKKAEFAKEEVVLNDKTDKPGFEGNYPNPFNPSTIIKFNLAEESHVSLKIYNILAQEVAALVDEIKSKGSHSINFNASNLPAGIYIARLQAGALTSSIKMQLIK